VWHERAWKASLKDLDGTGLQMVVDPEDIEDGDSQ
jgi:hypothetical protein